MKPLHARYPFLSSARDAVDAANVDLAALVQREDDPVVARAVERVRQAIDDGTVGESHREARVELLSYPVARVLVSLVDEAVLTRRYAHAEAATAYERFTAEFNDRTELRSVERDRLTLADALADFDLLDDVTPVDGGWEDADEFSVAVPTYLRLSSSLRGDDWRLVNRTLDEGAVPVNRMELYRLLQQAVHHRVDDGLPLTVPDAIADPLADAVADIQQVLSDLDLTRDIDTVVPELFPPCMTHLLERIQAGDHLEHHSRFAITAFLADIGLTTDEIVDLYQVNPGFGEQMTRYQTDHIRGDSGPTEYSPPSCATMKSYGDCVNMDDLCDRISHPLAYYERKLDDADEDELTDWRDRQSREESQ
ncbi:DNA primase regulatory subunit PriL [Halobacteriaceae archaeon GCM10025711]